MYTIFSHAVKLGGEKVSSPVATIGTIEGVAPWGVDVSSGVCGIAMCNIDTHDSIIYLFW